MSDFNLSGCSLIAGQTAAVSGAPFHGYNPANGHALEPDFFSATSQEVNQAIAAAVEAFATYAAKHR
jgi:alpha-ketoglutaric semialdehyde dehydrogenase